ncbi:helix-turn-helix domain-containing protein [Streptomyces sp. NBC_00459]|uniref:helix-turn-helix domain-containing protein n=1 Tax=Streptomyces sp. NBC_00459 TaxID=2975749 RepID=UPI002E16E914
MPRWSPVPALRDAMEPCHAVQHCASRCREMFRDIAPMGTWRGDFGEHAAPPDGVPAFGVTVAVHDRDPGPVARAVPARCGVASPEDVPPARPAGVGTALPALPTAAAPLQPVGAHIVHESGLPLPEASQTTGS